MRGRPSVRRAGRSTRQLSRGRSTGSRESDLGPRALGLGPWPGPHRASIISLMAGTGLASVGLSAAEAARRRPPGGNQLPVERPPSPVRLLVQQLVHFFALLLWATCGTTSCWRRPDRARVSGEVTA